MPVRPLNRDLTWLLPPSLDEFVDKDHPARFVAAVVDNLDPATWAAMGIDLEGKALGAPEYHPRALLSVWLYGFMTGTRSSRKLEAGCREQMCYLWLTGWQHPDHNTLWRFYQAHREEMRRLLKTTVHLAMDMGLVDLAVQAVDGTKMAANAAKDRTYDKAGLRKLLERVDKRILDLEKENEEAKDAPPPHLPEKLADAEQLRLEVKAAMEELDKGEQKRINLTDGDAVLVKSRQGVVAGYNEQAVVSPVESADHKLTGMLITAADVVADPTDTSHLMPMLEQAEGNTGKRAEVSLADAGYHSGPNLGACAEQERMIVMPESQGRRLKLPYHKDKFSYDEITDTYTCPLGQPLVFRRVKQTKGSEVREYRASPGQCRMCLALGKCTKNKRHGRGIEIGPYDDLLRQHRRWMATEEAKALYEQRKELPEPVFGIIKQAMGIRRFLLRGRDNVKSEGMLIAIGFNLKTLWKFWSHGLLRLPSQPSTASGFLDAGTRMANDKAAPAQPPDQGPKSTRPGHATIAAPTREHLPSGSESLFNRWNVRFRLPTSIVVASGVSR